MTNTLSKPWLFDLVSIYINAERIGGCEVAPESPVGLFVMVDFTEFPAFESLFLSLHLILHFCNKSLPIFGNLVSVVSVICILSYLVRS